MCVVHCSIHAMSEMSEELKHLLTLRLVQGGVIFKASLALCQKP